jgi:SNF2 family DNA or RNA helicase
MTDPSSKLDALLELIQDREEEQIVVWSQLKGVINLLAQRLEKKGITYSLLTGDVNQRDREINVREFQEGKRRIFAGTIAAGGEGIQLQVASTAVFLDRMWNPTKNKQAEDREHRIGQDNAVEVIDIMARNTVDLGKAQQLAKKWTWIQQMLGDTVDTDQIIRAIEKESGEHD